MVIVFCDRCKAKVTNRRNIKICVDQICKEIDLCSKCISDLKIKPKIMNSDASKDDFIAILNELVKTVCKKEIAKIQEPFRE